MHDYHISVVFTHVYTEGTHIIRIINHIKGSYFPSNKHHLKRCIQRTAEKTFSLIDYRSIDNSTGSMLQSLKCFPSAKIKKEKNKNAKTLSMVEIHAINSYRAALELW